MRRSKRRLKPIEYVCEKCGFDMAENMRKVAVEGPAHVTFTSCPRCNHLNSFSLDREGYPAKIHAPIPHHLSEKPAAMSEQEEKKILLEARGPLLQQKRLTDFDEREG